MIPTARTELRRARWRRRQEERAGRGERAPAPDASEDDAEEDEGPERRGPTWRVILLDLLARFRDDLFYVVAGAIAAFVRAMGVTIQSGQTGLLFSFGRAKKELAPGFHILIPFVQRARKLPTRSRTLDLPSQRVATIEGLVYLADANLVYRIVDVRRAWIEIDDLEKGMLQALGLGVQEVLRSATRRQLVTGEGLGDQLEANLAERLDPWGVTVERAGFPSITPSPRTLRVTQLSETVLERRRQLAQLSTAVGTSSALGLIGTRRVPRIRVRALRLYTDHRRRTLRVRKRFEAAGWSGVDLKRAELVAHERLAWNRAAVPFAR